MEESPSAVTVIHDEHIHLLPPAQLLGGDEQLLFQRFRRLLRRQGDQTFESTGHKVCAGNAAQKAFCKVTQFQWIEDVQQTSSRVLY